MSSRRFTLTKWEARVKQNKKMPILRGWKEGEEEAGGRSLMEKESEAGGERKEEEAVGVSSYQTGGGDPRL